MSNTENIEHIREFVELYKTGLPISSINPAEISGDPDYEIFKYKSTGHPIKLVDFFADLDKLPRDPELYPFYNTAKILWMIPLETAKGNIYSFILKGYKKKKTYRVYKNKSSITSFFGWADFKNFQKNQPILLCEGSKDAIVLKTLYPYTLATLTSGLSSIQMKVLTKLTNKFILAYDNDQTGEYAYKRDSNALLKNFRCRAVKCNYKGKDPGDCYTHTLYSKLTGAVKDSLLQLGCA